MLILCHLKKYHKLMKEYLNENKTKKIQQTKPLCSFQNYCKTTDTTNHATLRYINIYRNHSGIWKDLTSNQIISINQRHIWIKGVYPNF